jgi:hypothetical protein
VTHHRSAPALLARLPVARPRLTLALGIALALGSAPTFAAEVYSPDAEYARGAAVLAADGNEYRTIQAVTGKDPVTAKGSPWRLSRAAFDLTLDVPGRFTTIQEAMAFIADATIADTATVTVQLAPREYDITRPLEIGHRDGRRVKLSGTKDPAKCVLVVGDHDGLVVDSGKAIRVEGLTIQSVTANHAGVSVIDDSLAVLRRVVIKGFRFGVSVGRQSQLDAEDVAVLSKQGYAGFHAFAGSAAVLRDCSANLQSNPRSTELTFGFASWVSSTMECSQCTATGWHNGFFAGNNASTDLIDCEAIENRFGASAYLGSNLRANGVSFQENRDYGLNVHAATAVLFGCRFSDNESIGMRCYGASMIDLRGRPCDVSGSPLAMQSIAGGVFVGIRPNVIGSGRREEIYQFGSPSDEVFQFAK